MTEANPSGYMGCLLAMPTNYRQGWKMLPAINILAYWDMELIMTVKQLWYRLLAVSHFLLVIASKRKQQKVVLCHFIKLPFHLLP
jgi:hypothetical protein